jgi:hypothetical protein
LGRFAPKNGRADYWEAWEVKIQANEAVIQGKGKDTFRLSNVRFLSRLTTKDDRVIMSGFSKFVEERIDWKTTEVQQAGSLRATYTRPTWWPNDEKTKRKQLIVGRLCEKAFLEDEYFFDYNPKKK